MFTKVILSAAVALTLSSGLSFAAHENGDRIRNRDRDESLWDRQHKGSCQFAVRANICDSYDPYSQPDY